MVSSLFVKEGLATTILDMMSSKGTALGTVVGTMKGEEGGYDVERIIRSLEGAEEKEDSIVIDGTEISAAEIREAATQVMELFGLSAD